MSLLRSSTLRDQPREIAEFTSSADTDREIAKEVVVINIAHMLSLIASHSVPDKDARACLSALVSIYDKDLTVEPFDEDIHVTVEKLVTKIAGESGGYLNLGKSRNDQVSTALRMKTRLRLTRLLLLVHSLRRSLLERAKEYLTSPIPAYTHLQAAQPSTIGHVLLSHYQALGRDLERVRRAVEHSNQCPMGSAAVCGSTVHLDRGKVAALLGFDEVLENTVDAVSARDFVTETVYACAQTLTTLSSLCEEIILWSSYEFDFVEIPDEFVSTSSMMPHKRNPVVAELVRAKASKAAGTLGGVLSALVGLPHSYNLDLQELNGLLWQTLSDAEKSVGVVTGMVAGMKFNLQRTMSFLYTGPVCSTDLAEWLSVARGVPYRRAYLAVGASFSHLREPAKMAAVLTDELATPVSEDQVREMLNPEASLRRRPTPGGPNPVALSSYISREEQILEKEKAAILGYLEKFEEVHRLVIQDALKAAGGSQMSAGGGE